MVKTALEDATEKMPQKGRKKLRQTMLTPSSKELGFFNPRSQLDSTVVMYWPMQLKNGEDR